MRILNPNLLQEIQPGFGYLPVIPEWLSLDTIDADHPIGNWNELNPNTGSDLLVELLSECLLHLNSRDLRNGNRIPLSRSIHALYCYAAELEAKIEPQALQQF